jgi:RNA polymerase sigma factor for flagellar operon FliA
MDQPDFNRTNQERQIIDHLHLVKLIALQFIAKLPPGIELNDLIHNGVIGLIDAVKKYDPGRGIKFATYASLRIRGAILDELRNLDWASRNHRQKIKDVEHAYEALEIKLGRPPKEEEVAESMSLSLEEFYKLLDESKGVGVGVFRYSAEDEGNIADEKTWLFYSDEKSSSPVFQVEKSQMKQMMVKFINELPEKEKMVLNLYYSEELNLKEIGAALDLTESRISQIRTSAIIRLRGKIDSLAQKNKVHQQDVL